METRSDSIPDYKNALLQSWMGTWIVAQDQQVSKSLRIIILKPVNKNHHLIISDQSIHPHVMRFEMQPIMRLRDGKIFAYELLFRGAVPAQWLSVDLAVLTFLRIYGGELPKLFVNLSNEALLNLPLNDFIKAAQGNDIVFELSEYFTELTTFKKIIGKVNELTSRGLQFAIADFGSGHDGFLRLYSLNDVAAIKIDRSFLHRALYREDAAMTLKSLVQQWKASGIVTIAECVETREMLELCIEIGFNKVQGWHIDQIISARNTPTEFINSILAVNSNWHSIA